MSFNDEIVLKISLLGSTGVGKESIMHRYLNNKFISDSLDVSPKIGFDFKTKYFKFDDKKIKFHFINTAGHEKFRSIAFNYLKGLNGIIFVFDLTDIETFNLIQNWRYDFIEKNQKNISKILLGNKSDLAYVNK